MTQIQILVALILVLASSVEAVFESFRYVYSNETVELISSPFFQTFAARGINSFVTDSNCSEVFPNLLQPDLEFTNNDVMSIYSMEFVPDNSTLGGYYAFLFQDYQNHLYLRYFYNSAGNLTDVNITTNTGFDFCSTVYNPSLSFVVQVLCVNSSTTQGKSNQTVWKYSVSLPTKTLVSNGSATLQNTNFIKRLTTVSITLGPTIYEMLYEAYSNVFKGSSTTIIFSNSSTLASPIVVDLKLQQGIISADQINKIYSVQPVVDGSCNNCIYVAVGLVSRQISLLRLQLDMTQPPQSVVTNTYPIYIPGYQLDTTSYMQVTAEPNLKNNIIIQLVNPGSLIKCNLSQAAVSNCQTLPSILLPGTVLDQIWITFDRQGMLQTMLNAADGSIIKSQLCVYPAIKGTKSGSLGGIIDENNPCAGFFLRLNQVQFTTQYFIGFSGRSFYAINDLTHRMLFNGSQPGLTPQQKNCSFTFNYTRLSDFAKLQYNGTFIYALINTPISSIAYDFDPDYLLVFPGVGFEFPLDRVNFLANLPALSFPNLNSSGYYIDLATLLNIDFNVEKAPRKNGRRLAWSQSLTVEFAGETEEMQDIRAGINMTVLFGPFLMQKVVLPSGGIIFRFYQCISYQVTQVLCNFMTQSVAIQDYIVNSAKVIPGYLVVFLTQSGAPINGGLMFLDTYANSTVFTIFYKQLYTQLDVQSTPDGSIYTLNSSIPSQVNVNKLDRSGIVNLFTYKTGSLLLDVFQANLLMLESLYAKLIVKDLRVGQTKSSIMLILVQSNMPANLKLEPRGNVTRLNSTYVCSTNNSDIFQFDNSSLITYNFIDRLYNRVILPPAYTLNNITCGTADFAVACVSNSSGYYLAAVHIAAHARKSNTVLSIIPTGPMKQCNNFFVTDYAQILYISDGINNYRANGYNPSIFIEPGFTDQMTNLNLQIENWDPTKTISRSFKLLHSSNNISVTKTKISYALQTYDIEPNLSGNIYQIDLVSGTYDPNAISLSSRLDFISNVQIGATDGILYFADGTPSGAYVFEATPDDPTSTQTIFYLSTLDSDIDPAVLSFQQGRVIDFDLFSYVFKPLNFLVLYYDGPSNKMVANVLQQQPQGIFTQVASLPLNQTFSQVGGFYDFGNLQFLMIFQQQDLRSYSFFLANSDLSVLNGFVLHQVAVMEYFETSDAFLVLTCIGIGLQDFNITTLTYSLFSQQYPFDPVEYGNISLPFPPSNVRRMKCEAPLDDENDDDDVRSNSTNQNNRRKKRNTQTRGSVGLADSFNCYFGLVNGTLVRVSFEKDASGANYYSWTGVFVFKQFLNYWIENIKVFSSYVSTYSFSNQNYSIVNYWKNESSANIHSVIYLENDGVDYYIDSDVLYFQFDPQTVSSYRLHDAYLNFPKSVNQVFNVPAVMISLNQGEKVVSLSQLIASNATTSQIYFVVFGLVAILLIVTCLAGCVYAFRSKALTLEPEDYEEKELNEKQKAAEAERKRRLEADLQKSFKPNENGDDTIQEIENLV